MNKMEKSSKDDDINSTTERNQEDEQKIAINDEIKSDQLEGQNYGFSSGLPEMLGNFVGQLRSILYNSTTHIRSNVLL